MVKPVRTLKSCALLIATFLLNAYTSFSQLRSDLGERSELYENIFAHSHWEFLVHPGLTTKAKFIREESAVYQLGSQPQISSEFGVHRMIQLNTRLGLSTGLDLGLVGRNASYTIPGNEVGLSDPELYPFQGPITRERDVYYLAIPGQLEYRVFGNGKILYLAQAGVSLRFAMFNSSSNSDMNVMRVQLKGNNTPIVNFNIGGGLGFLLSNNDIFKVGVRLNYDPWYLAKGPFFLNTNSSTDTGTYQVKGSSFGLSLVYTRTKTLR